MTCSHVEGDGGHCRDEATTRLAWSQPTVGASAFLIRCFCDRHALLHEARLRARGLEPLRGQP